MLGVAFTLILGPLRWLVYIDPYWRKAYKKVHGFVDKWVQDVLEREKGARSGQRADDNKDSRSKYILIDELVKTTQDP